MRFGPGISCVAFLFLLSFQQLWGQTAGVNRQVVRARLVDVTDHSPVVYARVINKNRVFGVFSDSLGIFSIPAQRNDTLYISGLGFYPKQQIVTDSIFNKVYTVDILLDERVFEFGNIEINALGTYDQFKYNILHLTLPRDVTKDAIASIQRELKTIPRHPLKSEASIPLGSPITGLYMLFSKEGKSLRKLNRVLEEEKITSVAYKKFNREIVARITGLSGEQLNQFMVFCKPDNAFLVQSSEYEVYKKISDCLTEFKHEVLKVSVVR